MEQYSATCPHCNFVLQFYNASLFGRKGRCPKCRNKFVLNQLDEEPPQAAPAALTPSLPVREKEPVPAGDSAKKKPRVQSATPPATPPATRKPAAPPTAPATAKSSGTQDEPWEMDINRGMGVRNQTLSKRWVLPNVLSVTNLLVIAIGASTGMGSVSLLIKDCPVYFLAAASALGGLIATGFLVRRYDPKR